MEGITMKAINIIKHIETQGLNNGQYTTFRYNDTEGETTVEFVRRYFGGDFVAGLIKPETDYIAFWAYSQPQGVPDAVVTDDNGHRIYIYEVE